VTTANGQQRQLPAERFWLRYSPHHEAPLSGAGSFVIHGLVIGVIGLLCTIPFYNRGPEQTQLVDVVVAGEGGLGGNPEAVDSNTAKGPSREGPKVDESRRESPYEGNKVVPPDLPKEMAQPGPLPDVSKPDRSGLTAQITDAVEGTKNLPKTRDGGAPDGTVPGRGKNRDGSGGGDKDGNGNPVPPASRWKMVFNTRDGRDYANQLKSLGAILAVESQEDPGKATVYRDLTDQARGQVEDLASLHGIRWTDDKEESVAGLSRALGIPKPRKFFAYLPSNLEQKLARLESEFVRKSGKNVNQIKETVFELRKVSGGYEPYVTEQHYIAPR
jgi:hypothetical protein